MAALVATALPPLGFCIAHGYIPRRRSGHTEIHFGK
jgi:hypothetical protein